MPTRGAFETVDHQQKLNGAVTIHGVNSMNGEVQSISSLNNNGIWVPGKYRSNNVVIISIAASSTGSGSSGPIRYYSDVGEISGHLHAHIVNAAAWGPASPNFGWATQWDSRAATQSYQKALAKANSADLDLGVMLGELRETLSGLANPLRELRKYAQLWNKLSRQGRRPKGSDTLNMLSGSWLEWRYGIVPLISDIQAIIEHVKAQSRASDGKLLRKRGRVQLADRRISATGAAHPGVFSLQGEVDIDIKTAYTSKVYYQCLRPLSFGEQYGLDFGSAPSVIWELTPLSFVWDWFFSVGDWLKSVKTSDDRQFVGGITSQKSTVEVSSSINSVKFYGVVNVPISGGSHHTIYQKLDRRRNQTSAISPVQNRGVLGIKRQIDALSLTWQRMPKLRR